MRKRASRVPAHFYFPPLLAAAVRKRADQLGLKVSTLLGVLLRNFVYAQRPAAIELPEDDSGERQVRESVPVSISPDLFGEASKIAARLGGTVSRLAEGLARHEIGSSEPGLTIWPPAGSRKVSLR